MGTRAILLGASNLTLGLPTAVETARLLLGEPLDVLIASGHGRSYGTWSRVFGRALPSILGSGLWERLEEAPGAERTFALVTDVGNDIAYGQPPDAVVGWVSEVLRRLRDAGSHTTVAGLPLASLREMHPAWFAAFRTLLFPGRGITYRQALERAEEVDARLQQVAAEVGARWIEPRRDWYGIDPIHVRRRVRHLAWADLLDPWSPGRECPRLAASPRRWLLLRTRRPERWRFLGLSLGSPQPSGRLPVATSVSMF